MNKKHKKMLRRIIAAALIFGISLIFKNIVWMTVPLLLAAYLTAGYDILWKAVRNTMRGNMFDENFLMALATVSAVITGEYHEAVFVMVFYQTGELFQSVAVGKSRKSIAKLMEIRPDSANIEKDGTLVSVSPEEVAAGDVIVIKPGERIPLDGVIIKGSTEINTAAVTGESLPRPLTEGDEIFSGCVNISGAVKVRVTKPFGQSTVSKILEMTENAAAGKAHTEAFITRFARCYTPVMVIIAAVLAIIPPLFIGIGNFAVWKEWIHRAMTMLVISCPCALVISVPLSFFGGIGSLSKKGILIKGGSYIEALAKCSLFVFDKTGTLTKGSFEVDSIISEGIDKNALLELAATAEYYSDHPLAQAIKKAAQSFSLPLSTTEKAGHGIIAKTEKGEIAVGNIRLMQELGIQCPKSTGTAVYVAKDGAFAGVITLKDTVKPTARDGICALKKTGAEKTVMLTGDRAEVSEKIAAELFIDEVRSDLLPQDKLNILKDIMKDNMGGKTAYVGDGINDAPSLAAADVGIAMGAMGTEAAGEAADIVLMDDDPAKIVLAVKKCKKTVKIVYQNIWLVLSVKLAAIILGAFGIAGMWLAVFADVGVAVVAILNSLRIQK